MDVFSVMADRRSARAYLNRPVARADIEDILEYAGKAPSAINLQPWEYVIVYGEEKDRLVKRSAKSARGTRDLLRPRDPKSFAGYI